MPSQTFRQYMMHEALQNGAFSDFSVNVFGKTYRLHRLQLSQSDYFSRVLNSTYTTRSGSNESGSECSSFSSTLATIIKERKYEASPANPKQSTAIAVGTFIGNNEYEILIRDSLITQTSFELMIHRLYGVPDIEAESRIPINLLAVGLFFGVNDIIEVSSNSLFRNMIPEDAAKVLDTMKRRNYANLGTFMATSSNDGLGGFSYSTNAKDWDGVGMDVIDIIVTADSSKTVFEKARFLIKLISRRFDSGYYMSEMMILINRLDLFYNSDLLTIKEKKELDRYRNEEGNWKPHPSVPQKLDHKIKKWFGQIDFYLNPFIILALGFVLLVGIFVLLSLGSYRIVLQLRTQIPEYQAFYFTVSLQMFICAGLGALFYYMCIIASRNRTYHIEEQMV